MRTDPFLASNAGVRPATLLVEMGDPLGSERGWPDTPPPPPGSCLPLREESDRVPGKNKAEVVHARLKRCGRLGEGALLVEQQGPQHRRLDTVDVRARPLVRIDPVERCLPGERLVQPVVGQQLLGDSSEPIGQRWG